MCHKSGMVKFTILVPIFCDVAHGMQIWRVQHKLTTLIVPERWRSMFKGLEKMLFYYYHGASAQIPCMSVGVTNFINNFWCVMASYLMDVATRYTVLVAYTGGDKDCRIVSLVVANVNYQLHSVNNFQRLFPGRNWGVLVKKGVKNRNLGEMGLNTFLASWMFPVRSQTPGSL